MMKQPFREPLMTRRQLLQAGGIGILGLSLPQLLSASAPPRGNRQARRTEKSCIFIVQYGGASHHDSWDLKPDAPEDIRGPYHPIATSVPGTRTGGLMPKLGGAAPRHWLNSPVRVP